MSAFDIGPAPAFLAAVTGNVGVPGGGCNFMHNTWPGGPHLLPLAFEPPAITCKAVSVGPDRFAESVLNGRPYRMKALVAMGNLLLASANTTKLSAAFMRRDDRGVRWQAAAVPRVGESKLNWEVWIDLAHALAKQDARDPLRRGDEVGVCRRRESCWCGRYPGGRRVRPAPVRGG